MLSFILWLLLLVVLVMKGYYKTAAAIVLLPFVLIYGLIFALASGASGRSPFDNIPPRISMGSLEPLANMNEITALPIKYETGVISSLT